MLFMPNRQASFQKNTFTPLPISALGTHSDWVYTGGAWGRAGQQRVADLTLAAGIRRLYWRTHNGGQACYPSKICTVMDGGVFRDPDFKGFGALPKSYFAYATHIDYSDWDQVADMAAIGKASGLETCHWYTCFEDDHGGHLLSDFARKHPEFRCTLRDGQPVEGCLDFWYPEVRDYKLSIIAELLERPCSRLLLDFLRRNGKPSADAQGHFRYGYNPEIKDAFRKETGLEIDHIKPGSDEWERWIDFVSAPLTEFVLAAAELARKANVGVDLLVWPVDTRHWKALDLSTITASNRIGNVLVGSQRYAASAAEAARQIQALAPQISNQSVAVLPGLPAYHGLAPRQVDGFFQGALEHGAQGVVLHESNHVVESPLADTIRSWSIGHPHEARRITAHRKSKPGPEYRGFLRCFNPETPEPDQETTFKVSYDDRELTVEVHCAERKADDLLPVPGLGDDNYNANQLRARAFWNPYESLHLFVDSEHRHEDYFHFILDPANRTLCERRLDEDWEGQWKSETQIGPDHWRATFHIPWSTLGVHPLPDREMGFQLFRLQNQPRELSSWFHATGRRVNPLEFGHLKLAGTQNGSGSKA